MGNIYLNVRPNAHSAGVCRVSREGEGKKADLRNMPKFLNVFVFLACDGFTVLEMISEIHVMPEGSVMGCPNVSC